MNATVREFTEADREALRAVFLKARDAAFFWSPPGTHLPSDFDAATDGERILVAVIAGQPVGFAALWEPDAFLHHLFVDPAFQGRGIGTLLLAHCRSHLSRTLTLKCVTANERARRFYESRGWRVRAEAEGPDGPYLLMAWLAPEQVERG